MRRLRRLVLRLTALALLPALAVFLVAVALRTPWVEAEVRTRLAAALGDALDARVSIGRLQPTLLAGVRARDLRIVYPNGARLLADDVSATYALPALLAGRILIGTLRLRGADVRLVRTAAGWGLTPPHDEPDERDDSPGPSVVMRRIVLEDARVAVADLTAAPPRRIALTRVHLDGALDVTPAGVRAAIARLDAVPRGITLSPLTLRGTVTVASHGHDVRIGDLALATRRTRLTGAARIAGHRLSARVHATPLSARELRALLPQVALATDVTGTVTARGPWRRLGVRADLRTPAAGALRLFGTVDTAASPMRWAGTARARRLDLAGIRTTLPASRLTGRVRGHGVFGLAPPLRLRVQLAPSTVAGIPVDAARVLGSVAAGGLEARGTVAAAAGRAAVDGRLSWAGDPLAYQADVRSRIVNLAAVVPGLAGSGGITVRVDGRGFTGAARAATARATARDARIAGVAVDEAAADLSLRGSVLQIASGTAATTGLALTGAGTIDLAAATLDGTVGVTGDVTRLAAARGIDARGTTTARIAARGPLRGLAVDGTAVLDGMRLGTRTLRRGGVTLALAGVGGDAPGGRATVDVDGLAAGGPAPWAGSLAADWRRAQGTDVAGITLQGRADDGTRISARATGRRATTSGAVDAQVAELVLDVPDQPTWRLAGPARVAVTDGAITADRVVLAAGGQRLRVDGRAGLTGPADATVAWDDLDLALACRLRGLACEGRSSGTARLTGTASAPRLALGARAAALTVAGSPAAAVVLTGDYADRALRLRGTVTQDDAGSLTLAAVVPADLAWEGARRDVAGTPLEVALDTQGLDLRVLRLLAPDAIRRSAGRLTADLRVAGSWPTLRADGVVRVTGGELALAATGVTWNDVELRAVARGDQVTLESLTARGGSGTLEGAGTMALVASRTTPFALRLRFRDFLAVSQPGYEAATDGSLSIEGALAYPVVRGDLTLTRLLVRPSVLERASGISIDPDPTIEVVGLPDAPSAEAAPPLRAAEALSMDVRVRVVRDAWIRRSDADVELRGEFQLGKAAHRPLYVTGELRLVRGWYAFQGRRFAVEESRIVFGGETPPDPMLDIKALHRAGDYEVTVRVTGRATQPELGLSSTPALSQADILSLLVFGRPARELGRQQGTDLQRQAISLASGYVAPELRQSIMKTLDLDTFELSDQGVSAGRYVTRDVFVTLAQDLTGRAGQTVGVEYAITRRLTVKLSTSTQGNSAVDVLWRRRY